MLQLAQEADLQLQVSHHLGCQGACLDGLQRHMLPRLLVHGMVHVCEAAGTQQRLHKVLSDFSLSIAPQAAYACHVRSQVSSGSGRNAAATLASTPAFT